MDSLLVWRCMIIFSDVRGVARSIVVSLPCLLLLVSTCMGTLFLVEIYTSSPFSHINYSLAYFSVTLTLNIVVTSFVVVRLLRWRRHLGSVLGLEHMSHYSNIVAIVVESASLYSVFLIPLVISLALDSQVAGIFLQTVSHVQSISSFLIIFRVASGRGWTKSTSSEISAGPRREEFRLQRLTSVRSGTAKTRSSSLEITVTREIHTDQRETEV